LFVEVIQQGSKYMKIALTASVLAIACFAASAQNPANTLTPPEKATYKSSTYSFGIFSSKWEDPIEVTMLLQRNAAGQDVYQVTSFSYFDPYSFGMTYALPKGDYEFKPSTTRQSPELTLGATWKVTFTIPPRVGSRCQSDMTFDYQSTVKELKTMPIQVDGKEVTVNVAVVAQEGTWVASGCGTGKGIATLTYAPEKKVLVALESLAYMGERLVSGTKTSLQGLASPQQ
jgi:hypothetical protein